MRKRDGELVPAVDLRPAEKFGTLTAVFDHSMDPSSDDDMRMAKQRLSSFNDEIDFILPSGAPLATLATGLILKQMSVQCVQVLEWDRFTLKYNVKTVAL